jgi:serine/threonine protein kinase
VILGTAAYERNGRAARNVDRRADIWGLGCILYEMLTGRRRFGGGQSRTRSPPSRDPDWSGLPPTFPAAWRLLRRMLAKDPTAECLGRHPRSR